MLVRKLHCTIVFKCSGYLLLKIPEGNCRFVWSKLHSWKLSQKKIYVCQNLKLLKIFFESEMHCLALWMCGGIPAVGTGSNTKYIPRETVESCSWRPFVPEIFWIWNTPIVGKSFYHGNEKNNLKMSTSGMQPRDLKNKSQ